MVKSAALSAEDWVEVRSKAEILATLDSNAQLDGLPFMPGMFQYCGQRFRVFKRAHKTCDTVNKTGGRRMAAAVHLEGLRCRGEEYGGCEAACLLFWKEAWLRPVDGPHPGSGAAAPAPSASPAPAARCSEADVLAATRAKGVGTVEDPVYVCQATQVPKATVLLPWWDISQYVEDWTSGNVTLGQLSRGLIYSAYYNLAQAGLGLGPAMRWLYDAFQSLWGGIPYPRKDGVIPLGQPTPSCSLNLQPGELVRVKSRDEILKTVNTENRNRGLLFDAEAVPFCGGTYRVNRRVTRIIDERTGKMLAMKTPSVVLDNVYCQARYSDRRMFCPRSIDSYWRELWLERVPEKTE